MGQISFLYFTLRLFRKWLSTARYLVNQKHRVRDSRIQLTHYSYIIICILIYLVSFQADIEITKYIHYIEIHKGPTL